MLVALIGKLIKSQPTFLLKHAIYIGIHDISAPLCALLKSISCYFAKHRSSLPLVKLPEIVYDSPNRWPCLPIPDATRRRHVIHSGNWAPGSGDRKRGSVKMRYGMHLSRPLGRKTRINKLEKGKALPGTEGK